MTTRRGLLIGGTLAGFGFAGMARAESKQETFSRDMKIIEAVSKGRLGVAILDTETGARFDYRANERFPMCSTFKLLASAAVLARVDAGKEKLDRRVIYTKDDLIEYSPTTGKHAGEGMTLAGLCEAAVTLSDNTAGNLILAALGGPSGVTEFARSLGDPMTRLDRNEPTLNDSVPGDPRDTTTPAMMTEDIRKLVLGDALKPASKKQLTDWMLASKTGGKRLRAGLPADWRIGDKTGTGERGSTNDIGVIWPAEGAPIVASVYLTGTSAPREACNATIAAVGQRIATIVRRAK
jgi:beta-lactamase class A